MINKWVSVDHNFKTCTSASQQGVEARVEYIVMTSTSSIQISEHDHKEQAQTLNGEVVKMEESNFGKM